MGRTNTKKLRIPIEEGVITFGSGYQIGPRPRKIQNVTKNYITATLGARFPFGKPNLPVEVASINFSAACIPTDTSGIGAWLDTTTLISSFFLGAVRLSDGRKRVYNLETGLSPLHTGTVYNTGAPTEPWSFAYMPLAFNGDPLMFITARGANVKKYVAVTSSYPIVTPAYALADYTPSFDPPGDPDIEQVPNQFYVHLNRLWMSFLSLKARNTFVFYSDPFDAFIIRGTSFIQIPDHIVKIFRTSASDVDISSSSHLLFGGKESLSVLDGDPTLGNAVFRQISRNFGITWATHVAETSRGAVFIGTDDLVYLFPIGSFEPIPIGLNIRDKSSHLNKKLTLGWRHPYLYLFDGVSFNIWIADLINTDKSVYWSGPHKAIRDVFIPSFYSDHPFSSAKTYAVVSNGNDPLTIARVHDPDRGDPAQVLQTGYIFEEDTDVMFQRAWFDFKQLSTEQEFTLRVYNPDGLLDSYDFTVPAANPGPASVDTIAKTRVVAQQQIQIFGDFIWLELLGTTLENIRNWHIEYFVEPRKD